jgi:hypothetical protein
MSEQVITSTPVGAPDILRNQPLSRQVDVNLETNILEPVSHSYASAQGGRTTFVLPPKGVLDAPNAAIVFEVQCPAADLLTCFNYANGGLGMIDRITARCGGIIISQVENAGQYANIKQNYASQGVKEGILDYRHLSSQGVELSIAPAKIAVSSITQEFQQLYNPECDQTSSFGRSYNGNAQNAHQTQVSKCISATAGQSPEVVIRLADVFEIFAENKLPLMAMAQVEIEIEWAAAGDANLPAANVIDSPVIDSLIPDAAVHVAAVKLQQGILTMSTPNMMLDYIHYDDVERAKIYAAVNSGGGMRLDFSEVVITRGVNPAGTAVSGGADDTTQVVASNHIIGMAQKEVQKIYVQKTYDLRSTTGKIGTGEADADDNGVKTHRNILLNQFKSTQIPGETYNFFINNQRIYDRDIQNPAVAHDYLSQIGGTWTTPKCYFNTNNYNANGMKELLDCSWESGAATQDLNQGKTHRYLAGANNYIGLSLEKYREMGVMPGNGTRVGSSPIEFNYSRVCIGKSNGNGGAVASSNAEVNLTFYICYRRSLIIRQLGVDVSDA